MQFDYNKFTRSFRSATSKLTPVEVAKLTGVNRTVCHMLMASDKPSPNRDNFAKICKWLGKPMETFFIQQSK